MSQTLEIYLSIFITVSAVLLIIVSVFVIRLMSELSKLTTNLTDITTVIKSDIEPTMAELKTTLQSLNSIVKQADQKVSDFRGLATKLLGLGSVTFSGLKGLTGGFAKGVAAGMSIFRKH